MFVGDPISGNLPITFAPLRCVATATGREAELHRSKDTPCSAFCAVGMHGGYHQTRWGQHSHLSIGTIMEIRRNAKRGLDGPNPRIDWRSRQEGQTVP